MRENKPFSVVIVKTIENHSSTPVPDLNQLCQKGHRNFGMEATAKIQACRCINQPQLISQDLLSKSFDPFGMGATTA